jgi:hypothetical protein
MTNTIEEYHNRIIRLKPIIEENKDLGDRIIKGVNAFYCGSDMPADGVLYLGRGTRSGVLGFEGVYDPVQDKEIRIAVKLNNGIPLPSRTIAQQVGAYERAFVEDNKPPYFVGILTLPFCGERIYALVMEDISDGGRLELIEEQDSDFCLVKLANGDTEKRFIDPNIMEPTDMQNGKKYLEDIARTDIYQT